MIINNNQIFPHSINSIYFESSKIGFGSTIIHMLGVMDFCKRYEISFNFDSKNMFFLYNDDDVVWDNFFESNSLKFNYNNNRRYNCKNSLPYCIPFFNYLECCDDKTFFISKKWALQFNNLLNEHLFLKTEFNSIIQNRVNFISNLNAFGVHLRGTDMEQHGKLIPISDKLDQIESAFQSSNLNKIFVMTDESRLLELMKSRFMDKIIYFDWVHRSNSNQPLHHHRSTPNGKKIFSDLIIEIYAMSKCKELFYSRSGVSAFIASLCPNTKYSLFDDDLLKHDLNEWKNKLYNNYSMEYFDIKPNYNERTL
jgi:hypothetical protein